MSCRSLCQLQRRWDLAPRTSVHPQRPRRANTHPRSVGEEAEAPSFMGGPLSSSRPIVGWPVLLAHPLPGHSERPGPGGPPPPPPPPAPPAARSLPPSLQRPAPCSIFSSQACAFANAAPSACKALCSERAGSGFEPACPAFSPAALGPNSGHHQGPSPAGISRGQALSQPGLSPGYLCGQAGQESSGSLCLAPAGWPSTWPPGDSGLLTRKTAPGLVTR